MGSTYLVPAPQSGPKPPHTSSTSTAPALPPPKFSQPRFPVIDLTDRESVHSFQLVTSKAGTGSENGETSERPVAESENGAQASLLVELREPVYREALPLLGARPPAQSTEYRASKLGEGTEAAETVRLRGRVSLAATSRPRIFLLGRLRSRVLPDDSVQN